MKARKPKPISKSMQKVHADQIEEYIKWHHPRLRDYKVEVSPCGTRATVTVPAKR